MLLGLLAVMEMWLVVLKVMTPRREWRKGKVRRRRRRKKEMISIGEVWSPSGLVKGSGDMISRMLMRQECRETSIISSLVLCQLVNKVCDLMGSNSSLLEDMDAIWSEGVLYWAKG